VGGVKRGAGREEELLEGCKMRGEETRQHQRDLLRAAYVL
jgi:hypothetical protein